MPGVAITSTLPTVGSTVGPTWASDLISWCNEVEADLEASIVPSEITVNQDFTFSNYKAIALGGAKFTSIALASASTGATNANMLEVVDGELRFVDGNGTNVQITSAGSLNASATGGITGNYTITSAEVHYSGSTDTYTFSDDTAVAKPAKLNCGDIALRDPVAGSNPIYLQAPVVTTSYSFELPAAKGTGTQFVIASTTGTVTSLDTVSQITFAPTFTSTSIFSAGLKVKATGLGSTVLDHFEEKGTDGETTGTSDLGWTPVIEHNGSTAGITYIHRYAWVQRIGDWVSVFANIQWRNSSGSDVLGHIKVQGLPYNAYNDAIGGQVMGVGTCACYPNMPFLSTYSETTAVVPVILRNQTEVRFIDRSSPSDTTFAKTVESAGLAWPAGSAEPSHTALVTASATSTWDACIIFQITYRAQS